MHIIGSKTSSSTEFLNCVSPNIALISVGENNNFGHPSIITIRSLQAINSNVYRTDQNGEITIKTDGNNLKIHKLIDK